MSDVEEVVGELGYSLRGKRILVTGGAGFIGSWMCECLLRMGARVICVDNLSSGLRSNIHHLMGNPNFRFIRMDVCNPMRFNVDVVIHLASRASPMEFEKHAVEILRANTLGTLSTLETARRAGARYMYASSSEIYGDPEIVPTPESYHGNVDLLGIRGCYEEGKRCGEAYVKAYERTYGLDVRIARIFNMFGPRMRSDGIYGRVIPRFLSQALSNQDITVFGRGTQTRSFCYITDGLRALLKLSLEEGLKGEVVNVGSDREMKIIELARIIKRLTGSRSRIKFAPLPPGDPRRRCPDIGKARKLLGWEPRISVEEGIKRMIR